MSAPPGAPGGHRSISSREMRSARSSSGAISDVRTLELRDRAAHYARRPRGCARGTSGRTKRGADLLGSQGRTNLLAALRRARSSPTTLAAHRLPLLAFARDLEVAAHCGGASRSRSAPGSGTTKLVRCLPIDGVTDTRTFRPAPEACAAQTRATSANTIARTRCLMLEPSVPPAYQIYARLRPARIGRRAFISPPRAPTGHRDLRRVPR